MRLFSDIGVESNIDVLMRCRGKIVPGSRRNGHNIFTVTGRNWLSKLVAWQTIGANDVPYTHKRVRWMGLGAGAGLESPTITSLVNPVLASASQYLVPIQLVEFPTTSSVRFIKEFTLGEITLTSTPVSISEAGLFVDANPAEPGNPNDGYEDTAYTPGLVDTILNPSVSNNPPVAYKAFGSMTKTIDFTVEVRWDFRFT